MATTQPQTTPQPPEWTPVVEPVQHVRLTPAWQDLDGEAGNFWLLEVPSVPGETAEMRMMISERHVVEMMLAFGRAIFVEHGTALVIGAIWKLMRMSLLSETDSETIEALRTLLVERASEDGTR